MKFNFERSDKTDQKCPHCTLYFSKKGIHKHKQYCPFKGRDETITTPENLERGDSDDDDTDRVTPQTAETGESDDPALEDGVEDPHETTTPSETRTTTDGGLGLNGAPEVDAGDQDESDVGACCHDPSRRALNEGTPIDLEDGRRVRADPGDELCDACGALVEADGTVRR